METRTITLWRYIIRLFPEWCRAGGLLLGELRDLASTMPRGSRGALGRLYSRAGQFCWNRAAGEEGKCPRMRIQFPDPVRRRAASKIVFARYSEGAMPS